jgi:predicted ester cyclase
MNGHDPERADGLLDQGFVSHFAGMPEPVRGLSAWKQLASGYFSAFPDLQEPIDDVISEGDKIVTRVTVRGTHKGDFMGIPPTGKQATWTAIAIFRVAGSMLAEEWVEQDSMGMLQQLGVMPAVGSTAK